MEKEKNIENNEVVDKNVIELSELNTIEPKDVIVMKKEVKDGDNDEPVRRCLGKMDYEANNSFPVGPMYNAILKKKITKKRIYEAIL
ncbi:hypothetical protein Tco_0380305 [Tanacetum coccineum]